MAKFVHRERKHKRLARQNGQRPGPQNEPNADVIIPISKSEKELRRQTLQEELRSQQGNDQISGKKRKRLDKYIDTKLKKEENLELLKKLAAHKVDTSLLQSSKKLGRVNESKRERFQRALKEHQAGIDVTGDQDSILFEQRREVPEPADDESDDGSLEEELELVQNLSLPPKPQDTSSLNAFGSGLKRPLDIDESGQPIIKKRMRQKKPIPTKFTRIIEGSEAEEDVERAVAGLSDSPNDLEDSDEEWNGFESDNALSQSVEDSESDDDGASPLLSGSDLDNDDDSATTDDQPSRMSAFKAWANAQRNEALGFIPSTAPTNDEAVRATFQPRPPSPDPDASSQPIPAYTTPSDEAYRPFHAVVVPRDQEIESARLELPVVQEEQRIMEAVHHNSVIVICGSTGSGKTTQVPQMLLENGYASKGMIGITQPRRVAATSVAARVSSELGPEFGKQVAHQVRYDTNVGRDTTIKFMTDGILLREISDDFTLDKYCAIVIDEAHERSVNTDILIGMLSRIVPLRHELSREQPEKHVPLKLIIMSASLRVTDFLTNDRLFRQSKPPVVEVKGRQYPVTVHFARRTKRDYVADTVSKICRGHNKLPSGGMLVFLTGQDEIQSVAKQLRETFSQSSLGLLPARAKAKPIGVKKGRVYIEQDADGDSDSDAEIKIHHGDSEAEEDDDEFEVEANPTFGTPSGPLRPYVLPLYASLPSDQQMRVFNPPPDGSRLIVLSTNVAETSLTIPGIRYVFDCGRSKEKRYDELTGVQEFAIDWISKASALQRTGRAGRTGPGHCYRLYSSAIYEQYFEDHTLPEILRTPIEGTVLQLKNMNVENVVNFPFPTPPKSEQLAQAEKLLKTLGAIDPDVGRVLDLGKELIQYPVNPRFGKMLMLASRNAILEHTIALVAGLAVGDLFIAEPQMHPKSRNSDDAAASDEDMRETDRRVGSRMDEAANTVAQQRRQAYGRAHAELSSRDDRSDVIKLLTATAAHAQSEANRETGTFCTQYFLREKGMSEVQQLRKQLHNLTHGQTKVPFEGVLRLATDQEIKLLKQIVTAGFVDQVAIRADLLPSASDTQVGRKPRRAIEVPYRTLMPSNLGLDRSASAEDQERQRNVYVHSGSVLARLSVNEMPSYIVYSHLSRAAASVVGTSQQSKTRMHPLTTVGPKQLAALAEGTPLLDIGKPIGKIEELTPGKRECWVGVALKDPAAVGSTPWPLGAWKVVQTRNKKDWVIEKIISR